MRKPAAVALTSKERVLRKWPGAHSHRHANGTISIYRPCLGGELNMGSGTTPLSAWYEAWENIRHGRV